MKITLVKNFLITVTILVITSVSVGAGDVPRTSVVHTDNPRDVALIRALDAFLPELLRGHNSPGINIALARHGKIVWEGAYGYADASKSKPATPETVFRSGSLGKTYTGAAIMQLVERGVISLDDPINKHLPFEVKNPYGGPEVTVFHLMTHTAGLGTGVAGSVFGKPRPLEEIVCTAFSLEKQPFFGGAPTWNGPAGEAWYYSNLGVATLGLIVERTNPEGLSFSDFVEQKIMKPLDMASTQYPPVQSVEYVRPDIWKRMSTGYSPMGNVWIPTLLVYIGEYPAGGVVSIPRDHLRFIMAMMKGGKLGEARILQEGTVAEMLKPHVEGHIPYGGPRLRERQGLIWWLRDWDKPHRAFHHAGGHMFGWRTMGIAWPEYDTAVVFALNNWGILSADASNRQLEAFIETWLRSESPVCPALPTDIDNLAWKSSYLRGLLFLESYRYTIGIPDKLDMAEVERVATEAVTQTWSEADALWNSEAFVAGVRDMNAVTPTSEAIHAFAKSNRMRIALEEARRIIPHLGLGAKSMANLAGLLIETPSK